MSDDEEMEDQDKGCPSCKVVLLGEAGKLIAF